MFLVFALLLTRPYIV